MANDHLNDSRFRKLPFGIEPKHDPNEQEVISGATEDGELDPYNGGEDEEATNTKPPTGSKPSTPPNPFLKVPTGFKVVSQEIRWTPTGEQVVDVIIEFSDYDPGVAFEHRLTKVSE